MICSVGAEVDLINGICDVLLTADYGFVFINVIDGLRVSHTRLDSSRWNKSLRCCWCR